MKVLVNIILLSLFLLHSCNNDKAFENSKTMSHLPLNERIKLLYAENRKEKIEFEIKYHKLLKELYKLTDYQPLWVEGDDFSDNALLLLAFFDSTELYGLPRDLYPINHLKDSADPLQKELALTESLFRVIKNLREGVLDSNTTTKSFQFKLIKEDLALYLFTNREDSLLVEYLLDFQPDNFQYKWLQESWAKYYVTSCLDSLSYHVPTIKNDSLNCYKVTRNILFKKGYMDSLGLKNDSVFLKTLEDFQELHALKGDHVIGTNTIVALEKSEYDKFTQTALSLEKFKWTQSLPQKYFRINIPENKLRLIDSNRVIREHKIIVGHKDTETPELKSRMRNIVLYPFWNVPHSIASTEILYAVKRDTGYFRKKHYRLFRGKIEVDAATIDWKKYNKNKFPFRVRQDGGPKNSLGLVKFLFPNEHAVYLHDTPSKWLFSTKMRFYSHGCMRMEQPLELAKYLIATDPKNKFIADSLEVELEKEERKSIYLRKPISLYVEYLTVTGNNEGKIIFYNDFYKRDEKFIKAIFGDK